MSALGFLAVAALVIGGAVSRLLVRGWTLGVALCGNAGATSPLVALSRWKDGSGTLRIGRVGVTIFAVPP